jgi:hypothetical protein
MLVVSLKRGQSSNGLSWKCTNFVSIVDLDNVSLSQLLGGASQSGSSSSEDMYQVDAVAEHHGDSVYGGHWTLNVRERTPNGGSAWRQVNDTKVTPIDDITTVVTQKACKFLLRRNKDTTGGGDGGGGGGDAASASSGSSAAAVPLAAAAHTTGGGGGAVPLAAPASTLPPSAPSPVFGYVYIINA